RNVADQIVLRERTSAETAERGIEPATASVEGRQDFPCGFNARAMKMDTDFHLAQNRCDYARNQIRCRRSDCVSQRERIDPNLTDSPGCLDQRRFARWLAVP